MSEEVFQLERSSFYAIDRNNMEQGMESLRNKDKEENAIENPLPVASLHLSVEGELRLFTRRHSRYKRQDM